MHDAITHRGPMSRQLLIECSALAAVYAVAGALSASFGAFSFAVLIVGGIAFYIHYARQSTLNYLDFKAVFSIVWMTTIGLAQIRIMEYQHPWVPLTWVNLATGHFLFLVGDSVGHHWLPRLADRFKVSKMTRIGLFTTRVDPNRLYWVSIGATMVSCLSFLINVGIKGFIPLFVIRDHPSAYVDFYTRFQIFIVAGSVSVGLSYYLIRKGALVRSKKIILAASILLLTFVIPILLVQRGTFLSIGLILTASVYILSDRRFRVVVACALVLLLVYQIGSSARGAVAAQFNEGSAISAEGQPAAPAPINPGALPTTVPGVKLPSTAAFWYVYLTVSHDNFNEAVTNKKENTWGLWQFKPFNVIFRLPAVNNAVSAAEHYQVHPSLNTYNLISFAFYDFGIIGVAALMFLWSCCFGLVDFLARNRGTPFAIVTKGVTLTPVALSFFDPWLSDFTTWLLWGSVFLMFVAGTLSRRRLRPSARIPTT